LCYVDEQYDPHLSTAQYSQLQEELAFVHEHDEHADIATGAHSINDSLFDEIIDPPKLQVSRLSTSIFMLCVRISKSKLSYTISLTATEGVTSSTEQSTLSSPSTMRR
jgi:hypothetical protein